MYTSVHLQNLFETQSENFTAGLIIGGFVFFTLLSVTVVWFLNNPLLRMLLLFTLLQTVLVAYDFQTSSFGQLNFNKLVIVVLLSNLLQFYVLELKKRAELNVTKFESNNWLLLVISLLLVLIAGFVQGTVVRQKVDELIFLLFLVFWFIRGIQSNRIIKKAKLFYKISNFLLWLYTGLIFALMVLPSQLSTVDSAPLFYLGWLSVSFIIALSLIHQVVQLNSENVELETEQFNLKNRLGYIQLETSENERKSIVSELHNDVLNRIDILSMTANQNTLNQEDINKNLSESLSVLRKYTYQLYPPHIDVLPLTDIFLREAEKWQENGLAIKTVVEEIWNNLPNESKMPIFRFVISLTTEVYKNKKLEYGIWNFTEEKGQFILKLQFHGKFQGFKLFPESYLIYKDLLNANYTEIVENDVLLVTLKFNRAI